MGKFVLDCDRVSQSGEEINSLSSQIEEMSNTIESYNVGEAEEFNFVTALKAISSNVETSYEKYKNTSNLLNNVCETHTNLQNSLKYESVSNNAKTTSSLNNNLSSNYTKYNLSEEKIKAIANQCQHEQGDAIGAAAEASLMANRYELYGKDKYNSIDEYVKNSGWWANSKTNMSNYSNVSDEVVSAVNDVLQNGNRTLPKYVDEHDYLGDITNVVTNGNSTLKSNHSSYVKDNTIISNAMGAKYTFYSFPSENSDPFGYTSSAMEHVNNLENNKGA